MCQSEAEPFIIFVVVLGVVIVFVVVLGVVIVFVVVLGVVVLGIIVVRVLPSRSPWRCRSLLWWTALEPLERCEA
jgi:hypothetical protein